MNDRRQEATHRLLRLGLRPDGAAFAAAAATADVDWTALLDLAQAHKVEALIAGRAADAGIVPALAPELRTRIADARQAASERASLASETLRTLAAAFGDAGVPYFVVKGSVLAHEVYGAADRRRFADIDVVVRGSDVGRAETALEKLGYRFGVWMIAREHLTAREHAVAERLARRFAARHIAAHDWGAPASRGLLSVDLHWQLAPDRLPLDEASLWQQVRLVHLDGIDVPTLTPAAALLHLAAHATRHFLANFRLLHLCDLAWAAHRYAAALPATWALAEDWRMRAHLRRVFAMTEDVLEIPMPRLGGAGAAQARRAVVDLDMLFAAPGYARAGLRTRLAPELRWALAMRSLHVNVPAFVAVTVARARLQRERRRHATAARPPA